MRKLINKRCEAYTVRKHGRLWIILAAAALVFLCAFFFSPASIAGNYQCADAYFSQTASLYIDY